MTFHNHIPNIFSFCAASCDAHHALTSFDGALLKAGIGNLNLVRMSSILPASCRRVETLEIQPGSLVPVAYASLTSDREGEKISAAVSIAIPKDPSLVGVIMEHSAYERLDVVDKKVKEMGKEAMAIRGIEEYSILSHGVEADVGRFYTTVFAGVVLWYQS